LVALRQDLSLLPLPVRTAALLSGVAAGAGPLEDAVTRWVHARARSVVDRLLAADPRAAMYRLDVAGLSGLGPGLTPTGDDVLVGLAAMAGRLAVPRLVEPSAAAAFAAALSPVPAGTTPAAQALLAGAAKGLFPSVLADVVEAIGDAGSGTDALEGAAGRLAATGAHSGDDLLAGALFLARAAAFGREGA
jgi:hypothetical protein